MFKYMSPWTATVFCTLFVCTLLGWISWNCAVHPERPSSCHENVTDQINGCMRHVSDEEQCLKAAEGLMADCVKIDGHPEAYTEPVME